MATLPGGVQYAAAKSIDETVPLGGGAQAQDETQRSGRHIRLIHVRHHGGIEQGSGFERILVSKIPASNNFRSSDRFWWPLSR